MMQMKLKNLSKIGGVGRKYKTTKRFLKKLKFYMLLDCYFCELMINKALSPVFSGYDDVKKVLKKTRKVTVTRYTDAKIVVQKTRNAAVTRYTDAKTVVKKTRNAAVTRYTDAKTVVKRTRKAVVSRYSDAKKVLEKAQKATVARYTGAKQVLKKAQKATIARCEGAKKVLKKARSAGKKAKICPYVPSSPGYETRVKCVDSPQICSTFDPEVKDPLFHMFSDENPNNACSIM